MTDASALSDLHTAAFLCAFALNTLCVLLALRFVLESTGSTGTSPLATFVRALTTWLLAPPRACVHAPRITLLTVLGIACLTLELLLPHTLPVPLYARTSARMLTFLAHAAVLLLLIDAFATVLPHKISPSLADDAARVRTCLLPASTATPAGRRVAYDAFAALVLSHGAFLCARLILHLSD